MRFAERFEDLEIWQEVRRLNFSVFKSLQKCSDFSFRDQMRRAALSVMNNIAEGFERRSSKEFGHFLDIARGSSGEVRSMTFAGEDLGIFDSQTSEELRLKYEILSKRIATFRKRLH